MLKIGLGTLLLAGCLLAAPLMAQAQSETRTVHGRWGGTRTGTATDVFGRNRGAGTATGSYQGPHGSTANTTQKGAYARGRGFWRQGSSNWNGRHTSGSAASSAQYKNGQYTRNGQSTVTNKKTGKTNTYTDTTNYNKQTGGNIDVTNQTTGKSKDIKLPPGK
jgi:hypothetical protein